MSISNTSSDAAHGDLESLLLPRVARALLEASITAPEPAPLAVVGTAGSGKSRVLRHLFTALRASGASPVALTHLGDLPSATDAVLVVDDAHLLDDRALLALTDRLRAGTATVLLSTRPDPDSPVLRALIDDIERHQPPMLLGHVTMADVTAHLGRETTDPSKECLVRLLEATGGLAWLTAEALMLHGDAICDGQCDHDEIARSLDDLVSHRIDSLDPSLRLAVEALCLDERSALDAGAGPACAAGYDAGLLQRGGRTVPLVRDAVRARLTADRLLELYSARLVRDAASVQALLGGTTDERVASALIADGDRELPRDPAKAAELYGAADRAGAPSETLAVRRARAAWALGDVDAAGSFVDRLLAGPNAPGDEALDMAAAVWAMRGDMDLGAQVYRGGGPSTPESRAKWAIAAAGAGHPDPAATPAPDAVRTIPTARGVSLELLARGLRASLDTGDHDGLHDLVRASEMYTASGSDAPLPELPAVVAALVALHLGEASVAERVLDAAIAGAQGGAWAAPRLLLWRAWVAVQREHPVEAENALRTATGGRPLGARDRLLADAVELGLVRRNGQPSELPPVWRRAQGSLLRVQIDLFTLIPLGEFVVSAARVGEYAAVRSSFDHAERLLSDLDQPPLWATSLQWSGLHASILLGSPEELTVHARALRAAAERTPLAARLARAGRVWTDVLTGAVDVDAIEEAAAGLAACGFAWDGARLASHGASKSTDRRVIARLLACARQLHPRERVETSPAPTTDTGPIPLPARGTDSAGILSEREREVAALVLQGKTYAEIGETIFISPRTAEHHIARIRRRLGATSRSDLMARLRMALDDESHPSNPVAQASGENAQSARVLASGKPL
ncbi:helix-turn-helix transcriptional regulator [Microbacterium sp. VKM Ac-2923]|uniref:helix-turn-helix transcriptional regulator n=1 Tax=Microbacterium sp. VKM Ac-2923 TaxID=2929476 RepID=UPI001FB37859|nr:helix-turn-helix transcriptional regulator [Microbacterium sp. VKM Ac-2923]MCJ1706452.1 helix-turn-helix transcriptional regulator [Microbacterium sp. VKM Ac-2923]